MADLPKIDPGVSLLHTKPAAMQRASQRDFDYDLDFKGVNFRERPDLYRVGKGEQGVLLVEPYKSELLPHWRFRTPEIARESASRLHEMFLTYKASQDFVGMDMARKYIQMGYTRARRYANHRTGKKYDGPVPKEHRGQSGAWGREILPNDPDPVKAESARIFREVWDKVEADAEYRRYREEHRARYG
jgi:hypothetical protein